MAQTLHDTQTLQYVLSSLSWETIEFSPRQIELEKRRLTIINLVNFLWQSRHDGSSQTGLR